jgi:hypothetical protein
MNQRSSRRQPNRVIRREGIEAPRHQGIAEENPLTGIT